MAVAWFQSRYDKAGPGRHRRRLHQLPADARAIRRLRRRAARRRQDRVPRLGSSTPYFDGCLPIEVMAERGPRDAAPRADEAVRPDQSARPDSEGLRGRAAAPGQHARHAVQHGRLPDQAEARRAGAHLPHHPGPGEAPSSRGSAACTATPSSTRRSCSTRRCGSRPRRGCASPARSPAARAMSSPPRSACWPAASPPPSGSASRSSLPPPTTAHGALLGHITGGHIETIDAGPALVPADERQFRPVSAARAASPTNGARRQAAARHGQDRRQEARAQRARARRSRALDRPASAQQRSRRAR